MEEVTACGHTGENEPVTTDDRETSIGRSACVDGRGEKEGKSGGERVHVRERLQGRLYGTDPGRRMEAGVGGCGCPCLIISLCSLEEVNNFLG